MATTIAKAATEAASILRSSAPRARQRTLDADDIERAIRIHLRIARKVAKEDPERVTMTTLVGGFVPNSYKYRAECDEVSIIGTHAAHVVVRAGRGYAQSRPNGVGNALIVRSRLPEQARGRIEHAE